VTYVFASLTIGGRLVVPGPSTHLDPTGMAALIATHGITTMECVPALATEYLHAFRTAGDRLACLTRFLTGGEALTPKLAEEIVSSLPGLSKPGGGLFNSYGPTEVTVTVGGLQGLADCLTYCLPLQLLPFVPVCALLGQLVGIGSVL
jgi:non-ribosomal peptide synthetase component F